MADERSDLCECIWSHEFAMQRLLSIVSDNEQFFLYLLIKSKYVNTYVYIYIYKI